MFFQVLWQLWHDWRQLPLPWSCLDCLLGSKDVFWIQGLKADLWAWKFGRIFGCATALRHLHRFAQFVCWLWQVFQLLLIGLWTDVPKFELGWDSLGEMRISTLETFQRLVRRRFSHWCPHFGSRRAVAWCPSLERSSNCNLNRKSGIPSAVRFGKQHQNNVWCHFDAGGLRIWIFWIGSYGYVSFRLPCESYFAKTRVSEVSRALKLVSVLEPEVASDSLKSWMCVMSIVRSSVVLECCVLHLFFGKSMLAVYTRDSLCFPRTVKLVFQGIDRRGNPKGTLVDFMNVCTRTIDGQIFGEMRSGHLPVVQFCLHRINGEMMKDEQKQHERWACSFVRESQVHKRSERLCFATIVTKRGTHGCSFLLDMRMLRSWGSMSSQTQVMQITGSRCVRRSKLPAWELDFQKVAACWHAAFQSK